jgi:hypothetical protein
MTYIQPNRNNNLLNRIIAGLALCSVLGVFWLIALYNNTVDLNHGIATLKAKLDSVGADNTSLNNQVIAALGSIQSGGLAAQDGLVQDNHPQYYQQPIATNQSSEWHIASEQ